MCMHNYFNLKSFYTLSMEPNKQFLKYDFLNSPSLLLKSLFCVLTCEGLFDDQFCKYVVFFFKPSLLFKSVCMLTCKIRDRRII